MAVSRAPFNIFAIIVIIWIIVSPNDHAQSSAPAAAPQSDGSKFDQFGSFLDVLIRPPSCYPAPFNKECLEAKQSEVNLINNKKSYERGCIIHAGDSNQVSMKRKRANDTDESGIGMEKRLKTEKLKWKMGYALIEVTNVRRCDNLVPKRRTSIAPRHKTGEIPMGRLIQAAKGVLKRKCVGIDCGLNAICPKP